MNSTKLYAFGGTSAGAARGNIDSSVLFSNLLAFAKFD
jgi:hypothetical protein